MATRPTKKTDRKKPTPAARKARQRTRDAATHPPAPRDLLAVIADQAKVILEQMALIVVLRQRQADTVVRRIVLRLLDLLATATLDHGEAQLRDLLAEAHAALDADGTRSDTVAADVAVRAIAERDQLKTERDAARDTLAGIADHAGLQNWQTATPEGLLAILDAVRDLRRGHDECFNKLQRVEKTAKTYESALQRAATLVGAEGKYGDMDAGRAELVVDLIKALKAESRNEVDAKITLHSLRTMRQHYAELLTALEIPYDAATYTDTAHGMVLLKASELREQLRHAVANIRTADAERAEALTAKRTADELLTHATAENAELRRRLAALDTPAAPVASGVS